MIVFSDVTKRYEKKRVLHELSLSLEKGEMVFLTGPSGAGKTTLLNLIYCFDRPDSGKIVVDNMEVSSLKQGKIPKLRRNIGIVFQDFRLFAERTVFDNVAIALQFNGMNPQKIRGYVNEMLEKVGLLHTAKVFPPCLSGGEQQRIVIARAMVSKPKVILADEPTGNLDDDNAAAIMKILNEISEKGTTVLIATHNKEIFHGSGQRVLYLNNSIIERDYTG
jgi:cell division transport system ATP-binding protein